VRYKLDYWFIIIIIILGPTSTKPQVWKLSKAVTILLISL